MGLNMKRAKVYRAAAERVDLGIEPYSCNALIEEARAAGQPAGELVDAYAQLFRPFANARHNWEAWGGEWGYVEPLPLFSDNSVPVDGGKPEAKQCRVLALCFMAAMVEAGDA